MQQMQIILLERVGKLGAIGDVVAVKPGYARNFLIPRGKAKRATKENLVQFEAQRADIEKQNATRRTDAEKQKTTLDGMEVVLVRASSDKGHLYGSVTARDVAAACANQGIDRTQVSIPTPIKTLGIFPVVVALHPEVEATLSVNVARSEEEAALQRKGIKLVAEEERASLVSEPVAEASEEAHDATDASTASEVTEA